MKRIKRYIDLFIVVLTIVFGTFGCTKDTIVFPEQLDKDDDTEVSPRGPVKQNGFTYITADDETIKFDLSTTDTERVKSLFFSINREGKQEVTEVTDFSTLYIIKNLPIGTVSSVEVWAEGTNGLLSSKYAYKVSPLPYPARIITDGIILVWHWDSGNLRVSNTTRATAKLFYKIDNASSFIEVDLPNPTMELDIPIEGLNTGQHKIKYYVTDALGGRSEEVTKEFIVYNIVQVDKSQMTAEVSSTESNEGAGNGFGASLLDDNINSYWHSNWSGDSPDYPHWIVLDLGKERFFTGLEMIRRHNNTTGGFKTFNIEYSNDKQNWTILQKDLSFNSSDSPAAFQRYSTDGVRTRYIRIYITKPMNSTPSTHLAEINVFEAVQ